VLSVLVLLALLALAACGGSGTTASASPSASPSQVVASPTWTPTMSPAPIPVVKPGDKLPPFSELKAMFAYDTSEPLGVEKIGSVISESGLTIQPLNFRSRGETASGYLVMPEGKGPFPVVVYAPGQDTEAAMWLGDAAALARKGYAGFLVEEPTHVQFFTWDAGDDSRAFVEYVVQGRRALDLLATLPQIDTQRIGFVSWSNGGRLGSFLSGVDDRIKAFVFIGLDNEDVTTYSAADQSGLKAQGVSLERYAARLSIFDPAVYFSRNKDAAFLFMWGKSELRPVVKKWYLANAPEHSTLHLFPGIHEVTPAARKFLRAWMQENL